MERTTQFRKSFKSGMLLGLLTMVCPFLVQAQLPTVTVSNNCEVVVAGTGGTLGFGGTVGSGGIVVMPDPGSGIFTINENGNTSINWRMLGDISFSDPLKTSFIEQTKPVTTLTDTIYSFNKNKRFSESSGDSNDTLARSIGRVHISYERELCNSYIEYHIYKRYSDVLGYVPPIEGENCWLPDKNYTYSVDQIASDNLSDAIGIDDYYWTVYKDNVAYPIDVLYYSADKSSITFTTPPDVSGDWYIECCYGKANTTSWGSGTPTTCVTKPIGEEPIKPELDIPACVPVNQSSITISVINAVSTYTYEWSSTNPAWFFSSLGTGSTTTINGLGEGSGTIYLTVDSSCGQSAQFEYPLNRSFISPYVSISGENCLIAGETYTFSIELGTDSNYTEWLVSGVPIENTDWEIIPAGTGSSTNGTQSIVTIEVPDTISAGTYTLSAYSCSDDITIPFPVNVLPDTPQKATGSNFADFCISYGSDDAIILSVTPAGNYQWTFPEEWDSDNSTDETITLYPDGETAGQISVVAQYSNGCTSESLTWEASFLDAPDGFTLGSCWNYEFIEIDDEDVLVATNTVTVTNAPNPFTGTYLVTDPIGIILQDYDVDNNGNITLTVYGDTPTGLIDDLEIAYSGTCESEEVSLPIEFDTNGFSLDPTIIPGVLHMYQIYEGTNPSITGATINWTIGGIPYAPAQGQSVLFLYGNQAPTGQVCVEIIKNDCTTILCTDEGVANSMKYLPQTNTDIKVYPNPNKGIFSIDLESVKTKADVHIFDVQGKLINKHTLKKGENILTEKVPTGTYLLLINVDGKTSVQKIQINN